ncbi:hypothetical protein H0H92_013605 [Tricholoma furcatifolium]|nr:hypothetical protein H0H92_013605 [Tricholoma furcatifolium]
MAPRLRRTKPKPAETKSISSQSTRKQAEIVLDESKIQENDIIYLVLGQTGAGKSSFINHAIGREMASVGHSLDAHTSTIDPFVLTSSSPSSGRVFLVDTPGFNDTWDSDRTIVKRILDWLQNSCHPNTRFGGIVYLHEISQARDNPTTNFMHPTKLSEPEAPRYVILATVKWNLVRAPVAELRESQLKEYWSKMADRGSQMARFSDSTESARQILDAFPKQALPVERMQKEFLRILGLLPLEPSGNKEGFISKLFGKITWVKLVHFAADDKQ